MSDHTELDIVAVGHVITQAKRLAKEYRALTGRPLGITGEVAEYEAVRLLNLTLSEARQAGYDAVDAEGGRIQIKGRVVFKGSKPGQRIGRIRLDHDWDELVLVLLDADFEPIAIYQAMRPEVEAALMAPGSRSRNERGALGVSKFKSIARLVWSKA
jgi:hypothetical protein